MQQDRFVPVLRPDQRLQPVPVGRAGRVERVQIYAARGGEDRDGVKIWRWLCTAPFGLQLYGRIKVAEPRAAQAVSVVRVPQQQAGAAADLEQVCWPVTE